MDIIRTYRIYGSMFVTDEVHAHEKTLYYGSWGCIPLYIVYPYNTTYIIIRRCEQILSNVMYHEKAFFLYHRQFNYFNIHSLRCVSTKQKYVCTFIRISDPLLLL